MRAAWYLVAMEEASLNTAARRGLRIGDVAPSFCARSTMGQVKLSDCRGRWLILFSHPADFTPVCTTEFVELSKCEAEFHKRDCALMALSVDSLFSHLAWIRLIRDRFGVEVRFPIVEDPTMVIGRAYEMAYPHDNDSATVRTTFFIDPTGLIRATSCYPANVGRSIPEMLRVLDALQAVDKSGNLTPANWQSGADLLRPISMDLDEVYGESDPTSWFYTEVRERGKSEQVTTD